MIWLPIAEMPVPNQSRRNGFESLSGEMSTGDAAQPAGEAGALGLDLGSIGGSSTAPD